MPAPFHTSRRVEFRDTDAAGMMHFTSILAMMEEAEHEFLRYVDLPLFRNVKGGKISWPRVSVSSDFIGPARFEDKIQIEVGVQQIGKRSVTYSFTLRCKNELIATGTMTSACCFVEKKRIEAVDVPADVVETLSNYLVSD